MSEYFPNIRGLVDARVEAEIHRAFKAIYEHFNNELSKIERTAKSASSIEINRQLQLFAGRLALPLTEPTGDTLATAGVETTLTVADIPNLPTSKITSGAFPLARIPTNILKTDDAFTITPGLIAVGGKITIKDNAGNVVDILTP